MCGLKLGQELGVEAMSLYNHVANKDDIVDGIIDLVFSEIDLPASGADWKTAMRRRAISAREVLLRHRWATDLMESRTNPGPATLRHHDAVVGNPGATEHRQQIATILTSLGVEPPEPDLRAYWDSIEGTRG